MGCGEDAADPRNTRDPKITVRETLDTAAVGVGEEFQGQPLVEAAIRRVIGDTYRSLGLPLEALPHLELAEALMREHAPETDPRRLTAVGDLAILYKSLNRIDDAAPLFEEDLRLRRIVHGAEAEETLVAEVNVARLHQAQGRIDLAERELCDVLARMKSLLGDENVNTIVTRQHLAGLCIFLQRNEEALSLLQEAVSAGERIGKGDHPYAVMALGDTAMLHARAQRLDEAIAIRTRVTDIQRRTLGEDHPETLIGRGVRADFLRQTGRFDESLAEFDEVLPVLEQRLGVDHPSVASTADQRVRTLFALGRLEEADAGSMDVVEQFRRGVDGKDPRLAYALRWRARILRKLERDSEAEAPLREALSILEPALGARHDQTLGAAEDLRALLTGLSRTDEAREIEMRLELAPVKKGD